jgi:hypothetical protein
MAPQLLMTGGTNGTPALRMRSASRLYFDVVVVEIDNGVDEMTCPQTKR